MDINQNIAACIQETHSFGSTVMHNICNGATTVVPWGGVDWAGAVAITGFGVLVAIFLGTMLYHIATDF